MAVKSRHIWPNTPFYYLLYDKRNTIEGARQSLKGAGSSLAGIRKEVQEILDLLNRNDRQAETIAE